MTAPTPPAMGMIRTMRPTTHWCRARTMVRFGVRTPGTAGGRPNFCPALVVLALEAAYLLWLASCLIR